MSNLVLLSGGVDSAVILAQLCEKDLPLRCLSFDYGQAHAARELTAASACTGLRIDPDRIIGEGIFPATVPSSFGSLLYDEPVKVEGIVFYSTCEHHLVPFWGEACIEYLPAQHLIGLSKLARLVDVLARAPQTQEALSDRIGCALMNGRLKPAAVRVTLKAQHMCMMMRGARATGAVTTTTSTWGKWRNAEG